MHTPCRFPMRCTLYLLLASYVCVTQGYIQLRHECKKTLWLSGLQLNNGKGGQAQYIVSSNAYLESYLMALKSATQKSPALLPVLVVQGDIELAAVQQIEALGGHVVRHTLTFMDALLQHRPNVASGLLGSYLRVDVAPIMAKVRAEVPGLQGVDTEYVLWTDPDVLFYTNIDSCTLPKPRYLSVGPDATPYNTDNCGVIYYNVSGFGEVHGDMVAWATEVRKFDFFVADQDMIKGYFRRENRDFIQHLPDTFNWKPYWGKPGADQAVSWTKPAQPVIVHMHGPKIPMVLCVLDRLRAREIPRTMQARTWALQNDNANWLSQECNCRSAVVPCTSLYALITMAYQQDDGAFYKELAQQFSSIAADLQLQGAHTSLRRTATRMLRGRL